MSHSLLFVDHAAGLGGAERSLLLLLEGLRPTGWKLHLAGVPGHLLDEAAALDGVETHPLALDRLRGHPGALPRGVGSLVRLARRLEAQLLYANTVRAVCYALPTARLLRRPLIWHVRDFSLAESPEHQSTADRVARELVCRGADHLIAVSEAVATTLPRQGAPVTVVANAIDPGCFDPGLDPLPFRRRQGIPTRAPLAGMVGRLRPWKGGDRFVRLASEAGRRVEGAHFVVVGGDPFELGADHPKRLRELGAELGLDDRLRFTGHLDDVLPALAAIDVLVHPGDPEPFGLSVIEAMAMAVPVVAFAHGALPEIVADGETGLLVPPGDEDALADAVAGLLEEPERRRRLGRAGRRRVEELFGIRRTVAGVRAVIEDVLPAVGEEP